MASASDATRTESASPADPSDSPGGAGPSAPDTAADPRRWRMLAFVALAQLMVLLDTTVVNLALPKIQLDLKAGASATEWVLTSYVLCFGGLMLLGGRTADRWGRRRTFLLGAAIFVAASLACGLADSPGLLIAARALQGCGAAFLSPAAMSLVTTTFHTGKERNTALGIWAALAGLGATLGVILGGLITDSLSWRWIFYINLPIGLVAMAGTWVLASGARDRKSSGRPDIVGAATATGALGLLVYAIVNIQDHGWSSAWCLVPAGAALLLGAVFLVTERRVPDPLVPLHLFATRSLSAAGLGRILTSAVQASVLFLASYYLQRTLGYSTLRAGFAFLPLGLVAIAITAPATRMLHRFGPRPVYLAGAVGSVAGLVWLSRLGSDAPYATGLLPALMLLGAAMQCCGIPVNVHGVSEIPLDKQGLASGVLTAAFQVGSSLGVATIATAALSRTTHAAQHHTPVRQAWLEGIHLGFWIAAAIAALNLLNAYFGFRTRQPAKTA